MDNDQQSRGHTGLGYDGPRGHSAQHSSVPGVSAPAPAPAPAGAAGGENPLAKALAIAAQLTNQLEKRKRDDPPMSGGAPMATPDQSFQPFKWSKGEESKLSRKVYIPVHKYPDINFFGLLIGPRGDTQKQLESESGARILIRGQGASRESNGADDDDDMHVLIRADTEDSLNRAEELVSDILFNPERAMQLKRDQLRNLGSGGDGRGGGGRDASSTALTHLTMPGEITREVPVPSGMVGLIIGKGGETIRSLQERTGAHIQIQKEGEAGDSADRIVTLIGQPPRVEHAREEIERMVEERKRAYTHERSDRMSSQYAVTVSVRIPTDKAGLIIGRGGQTIRGLQDQFRTNIQVPPQPDMEDPAWRTVRVLAQSQMAADSCKAEIENMIAANAAENAMHQHAQTTIYHQIHTDAVGMIIGKGGQTIEGIQQRTQTRVQVPPHPDPGTDMRTVSISGDPHCCEMARQEIIAIAAGNDPTAYGGGGGHGAAAYANQFPQQYADPYAGYFQYYQQQQQQGGGSSGAAAGDASAAPADQQSIEEQWRAYYAYYGMPMPEGGVAAAVAAHQAQQAAGGAPGTEAAPGDEAAPGAS